MLSASNGRRRSHRHSTARRTATASDPVRNADGVSDGVASAADGDSAGRHALFERYDAAAVAAAVAAAAAAVAADDDNDDDDGDDGCDDDDFEIVDDDSDDTTVDDEDANVAVVLETVEDGREPLPLIRAPPPRDLLAFLFLPKQVRGPVREVEESEYDWEKNP